MFKSSLQMALSIGVLVLLQMNESYGDCMQNCQDKFNASYDRCSELVAANPQDKCKSKLGDLRNDLKNCQNSCPTGPRTPNLAPDPYLKYW